MFCLPPGVRFAEAFASGFWDRYGALPPDQVARIEVLLNNNRSVRVISDALVSAAAGPALLPRVSVLAELGSDPLQARNLPPAISPMRRQLRLTRLVEAFLRREGGSRIAPLSAAPDLARSLAALLDECDEAGVPLDSLERATEGEHAEHWSRNLRFIDVIRTFWPAIVAEEEGGAPGPKARQRSAVSRLADIWHSAPPPHPMIAAASTGSVESTAMLLEAIARLDDGLVLLPGFDRALPGDIWDAISAGDCPEHPMAPFVPLLNALGMTPGDVAPWSGQHALPARHVLMTQALRPAPVTDAWHRHAGEISPYIVEATAGLALVEAAGPREEAAAIALATRRALEIPDKTVLILTQNAALGRRIFASLDRFAIEPDDSLGRPLAQSPAGVFLRQIADLADGRGGAVEISAMLSHPLCQPGLARSVHRVFASRYERHVLRQRGLPDEGILPPWPEAAVEEAEWLAALLGALAPLVRALSADGSLATVVAAHIAAAEALTTAPDQGCAVWAEASGEAAQRLFQQLADAADAYGDAPVTGYAQLITTLMRSEEIRLPGQTPHPRVTLMSPREARVASADLVILAGMNEGGWPRVPSPDPWLSRPMRVTLGLPPPERVTGLSAHDFQQAVMAPEVVITRSAKEDGSPTVPSRWLTRLEILLDGLDNRSGRAPEVMGAMRARGQALLDLIGHIHLPDAALKAALPPAQRPAPTPPVTARPRRLSVTTVETLVRDAYAVYARRILRLQPLDPLGNAPDFRDRGSLIHKILETFTRETPGDLPDDARVHLLRVADQVLSQQVPAPALRRIWHARVARFADWFLSGEARRRETGVPAGLEVKGSMSLTGAMPYEITARADRIDLLYGGGAAIYDYKAGTPPTKNQIDIGFNHQLHLQAAILAEGGFDGLRAAHATLGSYIGLTGSGEGGKETLREELADEVDDHLDKLRLLLAAYDRVETPYRPRGMVEQSAFEGDYDHLSRFGEWDIADG